MRFRRNIHNEQGGEHRFSPEAMAFWRMTGAAIGRLLPSEQALTFDEVFANYQQHLAEVYPEAGNDDEMYVAWCLVKLADYGMVTIVHEPVSFQGEPAR